MKIISKFSDYYDSGLAYGIDKELYFERHITHLGNTGNTDRWDIGKPQQNVFYESGFVKFCDKYYPFVVCKTRIGKKDINKGDVTDKNYKSVFYYNVETLLEENPKLLEDNRPNWQQKWGDDYGKSTRERLKAKFKTKSYSNLEKKHPELAVTPYYIFRTWGAGYTPLHAESDFDYYTQVENLGILKMVQFHKAVDPYTAFQELSMFVGALKSQAENKGCEISDKDRMAGHGMDKTSFRRGKEK